MAPWLLRFARRCNERDHLRGRAVLGRLAGRCFELLEEMAGDGIDVHARDLQLLVAAQEPGNAQTFLSRLAPLSALGFEIPAGLLSGSELRSLEPVLSSSVRAGFVLEQHSVVDPLPLVEALRDRLLELGVGIVEGAEVRDAEIDGPRVMALRASSGVYRCAAVVLAAGAWLAGLARLFGKPLPVEAGKGYSFSVRPRRMPHHALLLLEPHVGCSPLGERLRIAGTMELSGVNGRVARRRIESIIDGAGQMLEPSPVLDEDSVWCGLRPIAPDGLPIIDRHPRLENVFIAGAYSMLGMTLAAPAAERLAAFVLSGRRPPELDPFRATRFGLAATLRHAR
jgi:D-amino-acid dehydrogenase